MKGFVVSIMFIIINIVAIGIFVIIVSSSVRKSIITEEELSRASLNKIIEILRKKNDD